MNIIFFLVFLSLNIISYAQSFQDFIFDNIVFPSKRNPDDLNLQEWLKKLEIDLPNDLINETQGYIQDLTIYNISLESLYTSRTIMQNRKLGVNITFRNAGLNIRGKHTVLSKEPKNFVAKISTLRVKLPFFLVKNESGLVTEVDTTGFNIDLDKAQIELDIEDMSDVVGNIIVGLLRLVLKFIKANVIEKNLIKTMNEKLEAAFEVVNRIILSGVQPDKLNITINETDLADVRNSSVLGSVALVLGTLEGVNGSMSLNDIINMATNKTGTIQLKTLYDKDINFEFNITDKNNNSLGNFELSLDDLNVSGLNTWRDFKALVPYDPLQLLTYISLDNLTLDVDFSLRIKLDNTSKLVRNKTILYEKAQLRMNLQNNSLKGYLQFPFNNTRAFKYTNSECLNMNCIINLIDSNATGISALSFNETFTYIKLGVKDGGSLEEDLDDAISRLTDLFITGFDNEIGLLINAILNNTIINLVNKKISELLYGKNCPSIKDPTFDDINVAKTSAAVGVCVGIFFMFILSPYILCKAFKKKKEERIIEENDINRDPTLSSDYNKDEPKYCIESISIKWMKELCRIDPEGASLFLNPRIPLFFRIFLPLALLLTIALFVSSNTARGAIVFLMFKIGRRIEVPSYLNFSLVDNIHDLWVAGSTFLAILLIIFSLIWPYMLLVLMLICFCLPPSILSPKSREKILIFINFTGKFILLDFYVIIFLLLTYHFLIPIPVSPQSLAKEKTIVNIVVTEKYGYASLIIGTFILLILSHIISNLNRSLESHPDENKGEKAESNIAIMRFAKMKYIGDIPFRIIVSIIFFITLALVITGGILLSFAFHYTGLVGYVLDIFDIPIIRDLGALIIEFVLPEAYEFEPQALFTQVVYFATVYVIPLTFLFFAGILWFVPMPRKAQKFFYAIAEILNAWSCVEIFILGLLGTVTAIKHFTQFIMDDKFSTIEPLVKKYFSKILNGDDTFFKVDSSFNIGFWLFMPGAILFIITAFTILKVSRDVINERQPDHVKEYLKVLKEGKISHESNINEFSSRTTLANEPLNNNANNKKNLLSEE